MRTTKRPDTPDWDVIGKGSVHVYPISRTEMSDARPRTGLDLSLVQVVAGTGAALTAALLGSLFGIAGTLTGTAVGSTVGTVCTAVYTHQLRRTRDRLHHSVRAPMGWWRLTSLRSVPWLRVLAGAAVVFGVALIALTVLEASLGPPLSSADPGGHRGGTVRAPRWAAPSPHRTCAPTIQSPTARRRCPCPARQSR